MSANINTLNAALLQSLGLSKETAETVVATLREYEADMLLHSKLRLELGLALGLKGLPPRNDNTPFFDAIEKLKGSK